MIKYDHGRGISRSHRVQVGPNPGASSYDLIDYVKPALRKRPKALLIHTGTGNIQQEINTIKIFKEIKEKRFWKWNWNYIFSFNSKGGLWLSWPNGRIYGKLNKYSESKGYKLTENSNVDGGLLKRRKLHLNKKGTVLLVRNIANVVKYVWITPNSDGDFIDTKHFGNDEVSGLDSVKAARLQNPKNIIFSDINMN